MIPLLESGLSELEDDEGLVDEAIKKGAIHFLRQSVVASQHFHQEVLCALTTSQPLAINLRHYYTCTCIMTLHTCVCQSMSRIIYLFIGILCSEDPLASYQLHCQHATQGLHLFV